MRIRSVGHACLEVETRGLRIVTDPWWAGPAFDGQWHAFPPPRPDGLEERAVDYVYLSHGHDDHLHRPTLRRLRRGATALVPELVAGPLSRRLGGDNGLCAVKELRHGRTVTLRRGLKATVYVNLSDSILVLDDGDRVLVDANDALHTAPPGVIDHFCRLLRERHPAIDTLFLGYSGASWFPSCVRLAGKNDRAVAQAREELYRDNFVRIAGELSPRLVCAFAASQRLVEPHLSWMNEVRLGAESPEAAFRRRFPHAGTRAHLLRPGDVVDGVELTTSSAREAEPAPEAAGALEEPRPLPPDALRSLVARLDARVKATAARAGGLAKFELDLRLRDNPGLALRVSFDGESASAELGPARRARARLELRASILEAAMRDEAGLESIVVGCGAIAFLEAPEDFPAVEAFFRLVAPRPRGVRAVVEALKAHPRRSAAALWSQRWPLAFALGARLGVLPRPFELRGVASEPAAAREAA